MPKSPTALPTNPRSCACSFLKLFEWRGASAVTALQILGFQIPQVGRRGQRFPGRLLHQLLHRQAGAHAMHVVAQPIHDTAELPCRDLRVERRPFGAQRLVQLTGDDGAQRIRGEVAEMSHRPMDVLQAPLHIVGGG